MIKILIYDKYQKEYYEVIPVKKIEEKIEELKAGIKRDLINRTKVADDSWKLAIDRSRHQKSEIIRVLQQLIKENCEESEE